MVEFNLLPDVKLEFVKARRLKRIVIGLSVLVGGISLFVFVVLVLFVDVYQKTHLSNLTNSINTSSVQLKNNSNLNKILTIQNQLKTLPVLEAQTPTTSRLFGYVQQLVPATATISDLNLNMTTETISITGSADSLATVNQFVDTIKFTNYKDASVSNAPAFNTVVLSTFGYSNKNTQAGVAQAQYTITLKFDPTIFNSTDNVSLIVPNLITTRSVVGQPADLFKSNPTPQQGTQ